MEEARMPTLHDLACLLETAAGGDHYEGVDDTLRWLIEESTAGRQLYADLVAKPEDQPSLLDLARVERAVTSESGMPQALKTAHWLIAQSELARALHDRLEQAAADAGTTIKVWNRMTVLEYGHQLNRLLAAADDWQDPDDVLDPARFHGLNCSTLYRLCCAQAERAHGEERRRLKAVRDKLKRPAELERLLPLWSRRFDRLKEWLSEASSTKGAVDSLEEMARLLRSTLEPPEPKPEEGTQS